MSTISYNNFIERILPNVSYSPLKNIVLYNWDTNYNCFIKFIWKNYNNYISHDLLYNLGKSFIIIDYIDNIKGDNIEIINNNEILLENDIITNMFLFSYTDLDIVYTYGLCLFIDKDYRVKYNHIKNYIESEITLIITIIKELLPYQQLNICIPNINSVIDNFYSIVSKLFLHKQPNNTNLTYFSKKRDPKPFDLTDKFINRSITSFLQTQYSVIVTGTIQDKDKINVLINTLLLFLHTDDDKTLCSHINNDNIYNPGLLIQGIFDFNDLQVVIQSIYPITIINVSNNTIKQIPQVIFYKTKKIYHTFIIQNKLGNNTEYPFVFLEENMFISNIEISPTVQKITRKIKNLPLELRVNTIAYLQKQIERQAVLLIRSIEYYNKYNENINIKTFIKSKISDISEIDFIILLSIGDKLKPGIFNIYYQYYYSYQEDLEKRFNDLWGID